MIILMVNEYGDEYGVIKNSYITIKAIFVAEARTIL